MMLHAQIFKNSLSVADYTPSLSDHPQDSYNEDCQKLASQMKKLQANTKQFDQHADPEKTPQSYYGSSAAAQEGMQSLTKNRVCYLATPLLGNQQPYILVVAFHKDLTLEDK